MSHPLTIWSSYVTYSPDFSCKGTQVPVLIRGRVDVNGQFLPLASVAMWGQDSLTQTRKSHYTRFAALSKFKNEDTSLSLHNWEVPKGRQSQKPRERRDGEKVSVSERGNGLVQPFWCDVGALLGVDRVCSRVA